MVSNWEEFPMHDDKCTLRMVCLAGLWNFIDSSCVQNTLLNNPYKIKHQCVERLSSINQWWLKNLKDKTNCCVEIRNRHLHIFRWYFYGKPMSLGFRHFPILFPFNIHWCHYLLAGVHVRLKSWKKLLVKIHFKTGCLFCFAFILIRNKCSQFRMIKSMRTGWLWHSKIGCCAYRNRQLCDNGNDCLSTNQKLKKATLMRTPQLNFHS